jgi:hypothetical protein
MDPERKLIRDAGAQRSPWVVEVNSKGEAVHTWKGYSGPSFKSLNERVAAGAGVKPVEFDVSDLPSKDKYG